MALEILVLYNLLPQVGRWSWEGRLALRGERTMGKAGEEAVIPHLLKDQEALWLWGDQSHLCSGFPWIQ